MRWLFSGVSLVAATMLLTLLLAACGEDSPSAPSAVSVAEVEAAADEGDAAPLVGRVAIDQQLAGIGLEIDREVALPGSAKVAYVLSATGDEALAAWSSARSLVPATGHYPVIVGGPVSYGGDYDTELEVVVSSAEYLVGDEITVESTLEAAEDIQPAEWFGERADYLGVDDPELEAEPPLPAYQWTKDEYSVNTDIQGDPLPSVEIVLLPTPHSWETPAYLLWGGWNDVPFPEEQVAVLRRWSEIYDAHVVAMTSDVIEVSVGNPPTDEPSAIELAREQFLYAPDIVWQGTNDLDMLASAVLDASVWFFWWD